MTVDNAAERVASCYEAAADTLRDAALLASWPLPGD
jgi:hypothetical protein